MKIKEFILLFVILISGCNPDKIDYEAFSTPRIIYMVDSLQVDLNSASLPEIVSVVQSEAGLTNVTQYLIKSGNSESVYETPVTTFPNIHSHSISKLLPYTEDVVGFRVEAKDRAGRTVSSTLPIRVIPLRDAPLVTFLVNGAESTEVNYREGEPMPTIVIKTSSEEKLLSFSVSKVVNRVESSIPIEGKDTIKFSNQEKDYQIDLSVDGYQFVPKTTALKVFVAAGQTGKPKIKVATLKIVFTEIPGPEVTFTGGDSKQINEFSNITIVGNITADAKIKHIKFYRKQNSGNLLIDDIILSSPVSSYPFSIPLNKVTMADKGLIVEATDGNNKTTSFTCSLDVVEVAPAPAITLNQPEDVYNGADVNQSLVLTGQITTLSGFKSVDMVVYDNNANELHRSPVAYSGNTITLNTSFTATKSTRKIGIEAVDVNDKTTKIYRDVHVGYYYARVLMSLAGEDTKTSSTTGPLPGPFFSAKRRAAMSYPEGKNFPMECDIAFHAQSSYGAIRCGNMTYARGSSKFTGHTKTDAGLDKWGTSTNYLIKTTALNRSDFDETTIDNIQSLTFTGTSETPVIATGAFPATQPSSAVLSYQATIDGQPKNVILIYDEFATLTTDKSASTFYIKVKIEK
ncbi:MAG: hypothetical protein VB102_01510 [Paludibacter sp.]|nr:hypothetical protein [Paludibacter sp.]